jgi:hypothetical protein
MHLYEAKHTHQLQLDNLPTHECVFAWLSRRGLEEGLEYPFIWRVMLQSILTKEFEIETQRTKLTKIISNLERSWFQTHTVGFF